MCVESFEWWNTERPKQSQKLAYYCRISYIYIIQRTQPETIIYIKLPCLAPSEWEPLLGKKIFLPHQQGSWIWWPASKEGKLDFQVENHGQTREPNRGMSCESACYIKSGRIACLGGLFHGKLTWFTATNATGSIGTLSLRDILSFFKRRQPAPWNRPKHGPSTSSHAIMACWEEMDQLIHM